MIEQAVALSSTAALAWAHTSATRTEVVRGFRRALDGAFFEVLRQKDAKLQAARKQVEELEAKLLDERVEYLACSLPEVCPSLIDDLGMAKEKLGRCLKHVTLRGAAWQTYVNCLHERDRAIALLAGATSQLSRTGFIDVVYDDKSPPDSPHNVVLTTVRA